MPAGADVVLGCATRRAHLASADVADFLDGQDRLRDIWAHLLDVECACKCKTHLLASSNAASHDISVADAAPWGARILASGATMLGLPLHGHGQDLGPPRVVAAFAAKAHATCTDRLRVFRHLNLSVRERGMFCAFYLQSTYLYAYSVHWPSAKEFTNHRRLLARALYPSRAWIDMNALPEVLRYLRIAPVLAPDCLVLKAVIGLASRLLAPNLLSWESALTVLPCALGRVLSRLLYAFPRIRGCHSTERRPETPVVMPLSMAFLVAMTSAACSTHLPIMTRPSSSMRTRMGIPNRHTHEVSSRRNPHTTGQHKIEPGRSFTRETIGAADGGCRSGQTTTSSSKVLQA